MCLFWGSAKRASFRARKRGPPPRLDIQCLLSSSTQRASPQAQHRGPPLGLGRVGLPSDLAEGLLPGSASQAFGFDIGPPLGVLGSTQKASSQARQRGPALSLVKALLLGLDTEASSRTRKRRHPPRFNTGAPLKLDTKGIR